MLKVVSKEVLGARLPKNIRALCVATHSQKFRTSEDKPSYHSSSNSAQYYKIPQDIRNQLFAHGGIPKSYNIQTKSFAETCLMVREPSLDIINCIKSIDYSKPVNRFVLYGKKGSGKSLALAHVVHYGLETGHLILHVPWVGQWMRYCKEYSNSELKPGNVDINLDAANWLVHFKTQNAHVLSNADLVIGQDYVWSKREKTQKGAHILELIEHGISRVKYASSCVLGLCMEIKELSKKGKCKTMVAIDGYNGFFYPKTRVYTEKKEMVPPSKVTVTEGFLEVTKFDWNNAVCVLTVDEIASAKEDQLSHMPKYLLGKEGFEHLDPFIPVAVNEYTDKEFTSCMEYYRERKWVQPAPGQDEELSFLSGSNPYKLMQICAGL
ncbi:PREDICTED: 28S ribosomal protein S29, mitochondrial [Nicrophorus vespilloides]|uniref:Small ribosomal subunit protein mS29 n=1 Tax=Nicrophorus vespilloides TaxID=110193 RepID=A0ABM1MHE8_NICVS|nr:PREDICTED: 28S ribosomal protein S29, mitochondrial [Nicrophorus vespilloides]